VIDGVTATVEPAKGTGQRGYATSGSTHVIIPA